MSRKSKSQHIAMLREFAGDEVADDAIDEADKDMATMIRSDQQRIADLEAQVAALREALLSRCPMHCAADHELGVCDLTRRQVDALSSSESAARAYESRIRAEERKACAKVAEAAVGHAPDCRLAKVLMGGT